MALTLNEICNKFEVLKSYADLPQFVLELSKNGLNDDVASLLKNGKEWAFEFLENYQPCTHKILMNAADFNLLYKRGAPPFIDMFHLYVVMDVQGQAIEICRQRYGFNPSDNGPEKNKYAWERSLSLPEPIRMAYYHRIDGLRIPDSPAFGIYGRILPFSSASQWQSIDGYLGDLRLKKKLLPVVEEMIPDVAPVPRRSHGFDNPYINFMMFLNSWGSFIGNKRTDGDHLFVRTKKQDGVVYYIRDADVANMMILADPAEAVDRYCEHVLLRKEERFDFRPWAVPFESPSV